MPRDLKTIPTAQLKTEAKLYSVVGVLCFVVAIAGFSMNQFLSEGIRGAILFAGFILGVLFLAIGCGFFLTGWLRPKDWEPQWTSKELDPDARLRELAEGLQIELPQWVVDEQNWMPFSSPPDGALWNLGIKGVIERFFAPISPLILMYLLRVRLIHRDGRKVFCALALGRSRDDVLPVVGGVWLESSVSGKLSEQVRYSREAGWFESKGSVAQWRPGFRKELERRLDGILNDNSCGVQIPLAYLEMYPEKGRLRVFVQTLPRETHGGFGRALGVKEFLELLELLESSSEWNSA